MGNVHKHNHRKIHVGDQLKSFSLIHFNDNQGKRRPPCHEKDVKHRAPKAVCLERIVHKSIFLLNFWINELVLILSQNIDRDYWKVSQDQGAHDEEYGSE